MFAQEVHDERLTRQYLGRIRMQSKAISVGGGGQGGRNQFLSV